MNVERGADLLDHTHMLGGLGGGGMQVGLRRAGQFELPTRLERNAAVSLHIPQADGIAFVEKGLPAGAFGDAIEQSADAVRSLIGHRAERIGVEHVFFVLGADAPLLGGLIALRHAVDEVGPRFNQGRKCFGAGH